jgi:hypothetical protein
MNTVENGLSDKLSIDNYYEILTFLSGQELLTLSQCSQFLRSVSLIEPVWRILMNKYFYQVRSVKGLPLKTYADQIEKPTCANHPANSYKLFRALSMAECDECQGKIQLGCATKGKRGYPSTCSHCKHLCCGECRCDCNCMLCGTDINFKGNGNVDDEDEDEDENEDEDEDSYLNCNDCGGSLHIVCYESDDFLIEICQFCDEIICPSCSELHKWQCKRTWLPDMLQDMLPDLLEVVLPHVLKCILPYVVPDVIKGVPGAFEGIPYKCMPPAMIYGYVESVLRGGYIQGYLESGFFNAYFGGGYLRQSLPIVLPGVLDGMPPDMLESMIPDMLEDIPDVLKQMLPDALEDLPDMLQLILPDVLRKLNAEDNK